MEFAKACHMTAFSSFNSRCYKIKSIRFQSFSNKSSIDCLKIKTEEVHDTPAILCPFRGLFRRSLHHSASSIHSLSLCGFCCNVFSIFASKCQLPEAICCALSQSQTHPHLGPLPPQAQSHSASTTVVTFMGRLTSSAAACVAQPPL